MANPIRVLIVEARFYAHISDELARGAIAELETQGAAYQRFEVPGAFEIPAAIKAALQGAAPPYHGFIALGCVIRGETTHYETICAESARGLMNLALTGAALANGILTVENEEQALDRALVSRKNKGRDFAQACLAMIRLRRKFGLDQ